MKLLLIAATSLLLLPVAAGPAAGGGVFVPGYGSQGQPRAGAFLARADDPSALYYNPAGFARQKGRTTIHLGANLVSFSQTFQRAGVYESGPAAGEPYPEVTDQSSPGLGIGSYQGIPLLAVATDFGLSQPIAFGFGVIAAHGFPSRRYAPDYEFEDPNVAPPPQRYDVLDQDVAAAFASAAVAYQVTPQIAVGARLSWGFARLEGKSAVWAIRNYEEEIGSDAIFDVDVTDGFVPAFGLGMLYRPLPWLELGASYRSAARIDARGTGTAVLGSDIGVGEEREFLEPENDFPSCAPGGTADAFRACVDFRLPQTAGIGGRLILLDAAGVERADIELDVEWENWSAASDISVVVDAKSGLTGLPLNEGVIRHGFRDSFSFRLGGSYAVPVGTNRLILRAGAAHDTAAAPRSFTRLDIDGLARTTLGTGVAFETARFRVEAGGGAVVQQKRVVDSGCNPSVANPGCDGTGAETPVRDRTAPDPVQPLQGPGNQVQSPFNDGEYRQGYVLFSAGLTAWF